MAAAASVGTWTDHERIGFLLEAARQFGSTLDEGRIYAALQRLVSSLTAIDGLIVSSFDPATDLIRCEHIWSDGEVLDANRFPPVVWNRDGSGMQSKVILTGRAEVFDVARKVQEPNTKYLQVTPEGGTEPVVEQPATKYAMMAPMVLEGAVTGVVQAMSDRQRSFTPEDLALFEHLTLLMTPAWHNARSYARARQARRLNDRILETSPDIVYLFDLHAGKLVFTNGQLHKQLGYSEAEVAAMQHSTLAEVMHPEDAARLPQLLARYDRAADDELLEAEWRIAAADGQWHWFLNRARVFERDSSGKATLVLGFATDITNRKDIENRMRVSDERYRFLTEMGASMVWTAGPDGSIDYVNGRWREYFGVALEDGTRAERALIIHPDDRDEIRNRWRDAVVEASEFECEVRLLRQDGAYRWHLVRATAMRDEEGGTIRWLGISTDIHDQKEAEEELARRVTLRTSELEAAVKELEGFTYTVSHDLRGPLRAISAASMILREDFGDVLPPDAQRHLLRQADAAKKMGTLIDDLLKLSRIGRQAMTPEHFDLTSMARDVAQELNAEQRVEVEAGLLAYGDPRLLRFVLLNLVENAIKFSAPDSPIRIGQNREGFHVSDEGIGFDMQYSNKLFRPFERLVSDEEYPGTGIGLANVQRIVQRHGGKVWAESEIGEGATFYFSLPDR